MAPKAKIAVENVNKPGRLVGSVARYGEAILKGVKAYSLPISSPELNRSRKGAPHELGEEMRKPADVFEPLEETRPK